jgi:hypothetical protein
LAALIVEPMLAKSVVTAVIISGAAITYDIPHLQAALGQPSRWLAISDTQIVCRIRHHRGDSLSCRTEQPSPKGIQSARTNTPGAALVDLTE